MYVLLFSSLPFLYYFLPAVLLLYFIAPKALKNTVLLLSSLIFYAWGEPKYVFLMIATIFFGYLLGILTEKARTKRLSRFFLALAVIIDLGALGFFKYANFFIDNFSKATGIEASALNIALPIGISFYTFQILSYNIDVYRGTVAAQKNPIDLGAYITMFPQLIAGPIVRYSDIAPELKCRSHSLEKFSLGARRFTIGLAKKVILANSLGEFCAAKNASPAPSAAFCWAAAVAFSLQIYFDFSGYSDMAIGLGEIFGFHFSENFNYPYISKSVTEFWRRWHISLGTWFRDYVYIPMGGNRVSKPRWFFNIFTVWFLTGFWHGASWNFIVWGLFFAVLLVFEKLGLLKLLKKGKVLPHIYVLFAVLISFVIFDADSMGEAVKNLCGMFSLSGGFLGAEALYYIKSYFVVFLLAAIGSTPLPKKLYNKFAATGFGEKALYVLEPLTLIALLLTVTAFLTDGSFNPFLYFRF